MADDDFEQRVRILRAHVPNSVPCWLFVHEQDWQGFVAMVEKWRAIFDGMSGQLRAVRRNDTIPGFVEVRDQYDRLIRTIRLYDD